MSNPDLVDGFSYGSYLEKWVSLSKNGSHLEKIGHTPKKLATLRKKNVSPGKMVHT